MIKLYTDSELLKDETSVNVFPLLQQLAVVNSKINAIYKLVPTVAECDFTILPLRVEYLYEQGKKEYVHSFFKRSRTHKKPILLFTSGDYGMSFKKEDIYTVRLGGFKSKMHTNTFIMPPFIEDPLHFLGESFIPLEKEDQAAIGFVGHSNAAVTKQIKEWLLFVKGNVRRMMGKDPSDIQRFYPSSAKRYRYLRLLQKNDTVVTNFIFRKKYRAGVITSEERKRTSLDFYENIFNNPYTFCLRGTGNFSVRFYETLAMGRIPILVDTDCKLPFEDVINWKNHIFVIKEKKVANIAAELQAFHRNKMASDFISLQKENRELWKSYFTKDAYFDQLAVSLNRVLELNKS